MQGSERKDYTRLRALEKTIRSSQYKLIVEALYIQKYLQGYKLLKEFIVLTLLFRTLT